MEVAPEETDITGKEGGTRSSRDGRCGKTQHQLEGSRVVDHSAVVPENPQVKRGNNQEENNENIPMTGIAGEGDEIKIHDETAKKSVALSIL